RTLRSMGSVSNRSSRGGPALATAPTTAARPAVWQVVPPPRLRNSATVFGHPSAAPPLPTFVQIEPVGQCNLRCQMCAIQFRNDGPPHGPLAFMPLETFTRIVDEFGAIEQLHLQGLGEPMMHPRFFDLVAYAARRGIRVTTNSNL